MPYALELSNDLGCAISASVIDDEYFVREVPPIKIIDNVDEGRRKSTLLVVSRDYDAYLDRR